MSTTKVNKTPEEIKEDLRFFIGEVNMSLKMVKIKAPDAAKIQFAIVTKRDDGSGEIAVSFDCEEFLQAIEALIGDPMKEALKDAKQEVENRSGNAEYEHNTSEENS